MAAENKMGKQSSSPDLVPTCFENLLSPSACEACSVLVRLVWAEPLYAERNQDVMSEPGRLCNYKPMN